MKELFRQFKKAVAGVPLTGYDREDVRLTTVAFSRWLHKGGYSLIGGCRVNKFMVRKWLES